MAVYLVSGPNGQTLVDAPTRVSAINAVTSVLYKAKSLKASEAMKLSSSGVQFIVARQHDDNPQEKDLNQIDLNLEKDND